VLARRVVFFVVVLSQDTCVFLTMALTTETRGIRRSRASGALLPLLLLFGCWGAGLVFLSGAAAGRRSQGPQDTLRPRRHQSTPCRAEAAASGGSPQGGQKQVVDAEVVSAAPQDGQNGSTLTAAEVKEVGNLVEDDQWLGLGMELAIVLRSAVRESVKGTMKDFIGKDSYELGDLSKEADTRVKAAVAQLRGKSEYELGDLSLAMDQIAKDEVCKLVGKDAGEYEFGDLSKEVDARIKMTVADYCGKETYEVGDLSREVGQRVSSGVANFTGQESYTFGDISKEINSRRALLVQDFLGKEDYQFGDITKKLVKDFTGKEGYQFGDLTKKAVSSFTGKEDYQFGDITRGIGEALFGNKKEKKKE